MHIGDSLRLVAASALVLCAGAACRREQRHVGGPYTDNAWGMGEGQRLYAQMNCLGCHAHGGGGMGPPLMDEKWIYGFDDAAIYSTIVHGRPNGMPAFRHRLSDDQAWQLVAYVKSLGGHASKFAASVRDDHMAVTPGPARTDPQPIVEQKP